MTNAKKLRNLLENEEIIVAPGCYDVFSARIIEDMGFKAVYLTGYGAEASFLGRPDMGFMTMVEVAQIARNITQAINIPVIADIDTGFGGTFNIFRTIRTFEDAGVAGVHIEDQQMPKKCGCMPNRKLVSTEEMIMRIKAALDARRDSDFLIIGRSDAKVPISFEECLRRLQIYMDAGSDIAMIGEMFTREEYAQLGNAFRGKMMICGGLSECPGANLSIEEYKNMGIKILIYPLAGISAAGKGLENIYGQLLKNGRISDEDLAAHAFSMRKTNQILGIDYYNRLADQYSV